MQLGDQKQVVYKITPYAGVHTTMPTLERAVFGVAVFEVQMETESTHQPPRLVHTPNSHGMLALLGA